MRSKSTSSLSCVLLRNSKLSSQILAVSWRMMKVPEAKANCSNNSFMHSRPNKRRRPWKSTYSLRVVSKSQAKTRESDATRRPRASKESSKKADRHGLIKAERSRRTLLRRVAKMRS